MILNSQSRGSERPDSASAGDYEQVLRLFHPQITFVFAGTSPLGEERCSMEAVRAGFQQLYATFLGIQFSVHQVIVQGWPWNTLVATRFSLAAPRPDGSVYGNEGMQLVRLRWGVLSKIVSLRDTQKLEQEFQQRPRMEASA